LSSQGIPFPTGPIGMPMADAFGSEKDSYGEAKKTLALASALLYENIYEYNIPYCISTDKFELSPDGYRGDLMNLPCEILPCSKVLDFISQGE